MMCLFSVYSGADENFYTIFAYDRVGALRVKRNLNLKTDDVVAWCRAVLATVGSDSVIRRGKNYYIYGRDFVLTVNANSNTIITAHKLKK